MSVEAISWAFGLTRSDAIEKFVLVALANYADGFGVTWVSQATIRERCSCSERKVRMALKALEEDALILRFERRRDDGSRSSDGVVLIGFPGRQMPRRREDHALFELLDVAGWDAVTTINRHHMPVAKRRASTGTTCRGVGHVVPGGGACGAGHEPSYKPLNEPLPPTPSVAAVKIEEEDCNERKRGRNRGSQNPNPGRAVAGLGGGAWADAVAAFDQAVGAGAESAPRTGGGVGARAAE